MRVEPVNTPKTANFGAKVNLDFRYRDMAKLGPLKELSQKLEKSGTQNVYEFGKSIYTNPNKTAGKHDILLNGEKFDEVVQVPSGGTFELVKNFLQKCCDKEQELMGKLNPEISSKLDKIREFIKGLGLSVEDAKKWL